MKKIFTLILAALIGVISLNAKTLYLSPNSNWTTDGARFAVYAYGSGEAWYDMSHTYGGKYEATIDDKYPNVIFCRMNPGKTANNWDNKWNQTGDLTVPTDAKNLYTVPDGDWDGSGNTHWSTYTPPVIKFYITGSTVVGSWEPDAQPSENDSYALNLAAGTYAMKITEDGKWGTVKGYSDLTTKTTGLTKDTEGNICFTLAAAGTVTVTYTGEIFTVTGNFTSQSRIIKLVPSEEWAEADAKFAAWVWGDKIDGMWTSSFFAPINAGNDTLQVEINADADSIDFVRFSPKASAPKWGVEGENVIVWGEMKHKLFADSSVWTIIDWTKGQWTPYNRPCREFGLLIDGVYQKAKHNVNQTEWLEYMLRGVDLTAGQKLQICNPCDDSAKWVITKYANTSYELSFEGDGANKKYVISKSGKYDFYFKFIYENDEIYISKEGEYTTAVRDQCTDVMMQAFYNESYDSSKPGVNDEWQIGNTKWNTLYGQADSIGKYFDLIWLPPSANGDGAGYHPKNYSNQSSNWGTASELKTLINKFHETGTKVIADIVINHCQSSSGWMGFPQFDFGKYGKFQPVGSWICQNDEANTDPGSDSQGQATGPYDDGENWSGARDWAHSNVEVQAMFKAYLQWMREEMGYDGWRYDKGDGFDNWHHDNYNKASGPYIAFMECYSGTDEIKWRIEKANFNLMALDFGTKWDVFNSFAGWNYGCRCGGGLLGQNWGRYAVEFIDSHDWFLRPDNENEFGGRGNSLTETMKCRLLQANAFLLSMPGIPCVFYPHWKKYDGFLKPMIEARKLAGVHSESEVKDEYVSDYGTGYQATIVGKDGYLILCLGDKAHQNFDGYKLMASYYETNDAGQGKDASYQIWVQRTTPLPMAIEEVGNEEPVIKAEKFMKNGRLFIRLGDKVYDLMGNAIK